MGRTSQRGHGRVDLVADEMDVVAGGVKRGVREDLTDYLNAVAHPDELGGS